MGHNVDFQVWGICQCSRFDSVCFRLEKSMYTLHEGGVRTMYWSKLYCGVYKSLSTVLQFGWPPPTHVDQPWAANLIRQLWHWRHPAISTWITLSESLNQFEILLTVIKQSRPEHCPKLTRLCDCLPTGRRCWRHFWSKYSFAGASFITFWE